MQHFALAWCRLLFKLGDHMSELQLNYYPKMLPEIQRLATSGLVQYLMKQCQASSISQLIRKMKEHDDNRAVLSEEISHFWYLKNQGQPIRSLQKITRINNVFSHAHKLLDHFIFELLTLGTIFRNGALVDELLYIRCPEFLYQFEKQTIRPDELKPSNAWPTIKLLSQLSKQPDYDSLACLLYYYYLSLQMNNGLRRFIEKLLLKASANIEESIGPSYMQSHLTRIIATTFHH